MVARELSALYECVFSNERFESFARHKVIFNAICFPRPGKTSCVYSGIIIRYFCEKADERGWASLRETENPKVLGWAANSFLRSVDFPVPEGPEMTMGALGTIVKLVAIFSFFFLSSFKPSESIPVVISFLMGIVIGNWNRGEVEYCMDLCISLKSFGVLAAGRLKHSIPYQNLTSCI